MRLLSRRSDAYPGVARGIARRGGQWGADDRRGAPANVTRDERHGGSACRAFTAQRAAQWPNSHEIYP